jgi:hypothetical protein
MESSAPILGVVQQARISRSLAILKLRAPGETFHAVIWRSPRGVRLFRVSAEARRAALGGRLPQGVREDKVAERACEGARVCFATSRGLWLETTSGPRELGLHHGSITLEPVEPPPDPAPLGEDDSALAAIVAAHVHMRRDAIGRALDRAIDRVARRIAAIARDLERMAGADAILARAAWLAPLGARAPRGAARLAGTDWSTGEAVPFEVELDPSRSARENLDAMFKRARRLKLGRRFAEPRLAEAKHVEVLLRAEQARLREATSADELDRVEEAARAAAPRDFKLDAQRAGERRSRRAPERIGHRVFPIADGRVALVGKGGTDNDRLTFGVARPHDLFLHAKGHAGAHVIVPLDRGASPPPAALVDAAHLAAHFSDARGERVVDVEYTHRKFLRKPRNGAPGRVLVEREKVLVLRVDDARLSALLAREESP